ncbi:o-succinylbenzoate synthase [Limnoraphis robusta Tam1]|uniref:o-succinylbenzoate synthase n=1 Tax=Limnoraphis robusta CCNP1315 TaxID=3110306 RepID=A0ABU5TRY3_9CYAN|nr:o-succinylbenzoate synthase [Limnoraphis robusta]MEA5496873.1 o-succinylbenzoate synthase [Limnoraphis robusta BA-68 BA1]MEA5517534.1 o-succinylbenzoate synthase [Limnoraphis robusta CCNP1315]MEA5541279.1 o-succinylbenzoate synthase [Limnoraphis robusta Tam1]MEA5544664.1 o-succinylbenzoate synthase [Limnoraphis robusta CCNP1324]
MVYQFKFSPYCRQLKHPLKTHHGTWKTREGIIIRLTNEQGKIAWGEIAPLSWFGSETLQQALEFCQQLPQTLTLEDILEIPDNLPACQFGFESALRYTPKTRFLKETGFLRELKFSGLLPSGNAGLPVFKTLFNQGFRTFKWKIAVHPISEELQIFKQLTQLILETINSEKEKQEIIYLRLDANGGLSWEEANQWLSVCEEIKSDILKIEYLEQPLSVHQFAEMLALNQQYSTTIALDESVATLQHIQDCYQQSWRGIFVVKPAIVGSPQKLRKFCRENKIDAVFSSVFETPVGRQAALNLASQLSDPKRAVGFGIGHWFQENDQSWWCELSSTF